MSKRLITLHVLKATVAVCLLMSAGPAAAQAAPPALTGKVTSEREGPMEGVPVSARKPGATVTVTVVSDAKGDYAFPADRLKSGRYELTIRAVGYDPSLDRVTCHVSYQINYDFFEKWLFSLVPSEDVASFDQEMKVIKDIRRFSIGVVPGKTFSIQPNGRGGMSMDILSNN